MALTMKSLYKICMPAFAAALAFTAITASAQPSLVVKDDAMQLKADKVALQRQISRLDADEARLAADTKSGRMSAESKDAYSVYQDQLAVKGEKKDMTIDKTASLQMKADRAGLQRQVKRLELAEARLKADTKEGKMAAESKDAERVYLDKQAEKGAKKDISADLTRQIADQKK